MSHQQQKNKYITLNASESAFLQDADTLLPRGEIYEPLVELIKQALHRATVAMSNGKSINEQREHNSISIDGARGTGKTAVLVNLKRYLELEHKDLLPEVHILEPIDPTLLENGESLFLHIVVAALLHDEQIKKAQQHKPDEARKLNHALDKLAHALEGVETQQERHGMDKVRAMYGNKQLVYCVQEFFQAAVQLIGKKLLILPIDDVDTSLNLAFENLEIIRRYLTSSNVLPIVSGDRALYHEVTWRDFHGRLTKDSSYKRGHAYITAVELAEEYQRKVLPFPRRLTMPEVSGYWQWSYHRKKESDQGVTLGNSADAMPLANFISWLEIYLIGPVNGQESSRFPLPIPSIRALTQLISHCSSFIPKLPDAIRSAKSDLEVRRVWQMPTVPLDAMAEFQRKYQEQGEKTKREYGDAYKVFAEKMQTLPAVDYSYDKTQQKKDSKDWLEEKDLARKLADYFRFEPKAGTVYLILMAKLHLQKWAEGDSLVRRGSIFDTPLFQPLTHAAANLDLFDKSEDLSAWAHALATRLPQEWLTGLKSQKTILPYPVAEVGVNASKRWDYSKEIKEFSIDGLDEDIKRKATFLITLLAQRNFYTNAKQTMLLNIGRIFELIIASLAGPISKADLQSILVGAPFFSTRALAPTKTLLDTPEQYDNAVFVEVEDVINEEYDPISELQQQIETWRQQHQLEQIQLSPWLVYKVFNKVYSQVASSENIPRGMKHVGTALDMIAHTFYATWFAFGSFEKGELFGLPNVVATTNLNPDKLRNFEKNDNFITNILPFAPSGSFVHSPTGESYTSKSIFGKHSRSISYSLAEHPLKKWIDAVLVVNWPAPITNARLWLCDQLGIETKRLTIQLISLQLKEKSYNECQNLLIEMKRLFPSKADQVPKGLLEKAILQSFPDEA